MAKTEKTCIVCGKKFKGTAKAKVCGGTCRTKLSRTKKTSLKTIETKKEILLDKKREDNWMEKELERLKAMPKKVSQYEHVGLSPMQLEIRKKKLGY